MLLCLKLDFARFFFISHPMFFAVSPINFLLSFYSSSYNWNLQFVSYRKAVFNTFMGYLHNQRFFIELLRFLFEVVLKVLKVFFVGLNFRFVI